MRKLALIVFGVAFALALLVLGLAASNDESAVVFVNGSPPNSEVVSMAPGGADCEQLMVPVDFDVLRLVTVGQTGDQPLRAAVRDGRDAVVARSKAQVPSGNAQVAIQLGRVAGGRMLKVCVANASRRRIGLLGTPGGRQGSTDRVARAGDPTLIFEREPRSLLTRAPEIFERAAVFKPGFLGAWTFWLLAGLVIVGAPALMAAALTRALREDSPTTTLRRWSRFQSEVESKLAADPRVHLFAQRPMVGERGLTGEPVALCIEPLEGGDPQRTRASIERQTHAPVAVVEGTLTNALAVTTASHIAVVRAGDELAPIAVERLGQAAAMTPGSGFITCDEDELNGSGHRQNPDLRPGPSPDLLLAKDLTGSLVCLSRRSLDRVALADGAWRYRTALNVGGRNGEGLAHVPAILCHRGGGASEWKSRALEDMSALDERGVKVEQVGAIRRIRRPLAGEPSVDVIVLFRDRPELLRRCVDSVLSSTSYEHFRVRLVDNGSESPEIVELTQRLSRDSRVTVSQDDRRFNFAALNNSAATGSAADFLVFLNNDTELITPTWIEDLLEEAQRPEVGAVAPLLLYPDGTVQHAGAAVGLHGYAGHPFAGLAPDEQTPFGSATDGTRNWLAVTAACLLVERRKFEEVGGFDESFVVAGNDVDLCLRLTAAGYRSLCVPYVRVIHDESTSRGAHIDPGDFGRSELSYGEFRTIGDPFYNPNLTLTRTDCGVRLPEEI